MSGQKDRDIIAEAAGRRASETLDYLEAHANAERERIIAEVMARLEHKNKEPLDPAWAVQKWVELHASVRFESRMRRIVSRGAAAADRNAEMYPDIG